MMISGMWLLWLGCTSGGTKVASSALEDSSVIVEVSAEQADSNGDGVINQNEQWLADCSVEEPSFHMVDVGEVKLHVACQGTGPTVVLLHGFPEFWYSWHHVMDELATDFRLIVPDQRGYNLSDKPPQISDYQLDKLVADIGGLIDRVSDDEVAIVGHDWGGPVAWAAAHTYPDKIHTMISANGPHPDVMEELLRTDPEQQQASSYIEQFVQEGVEDLFIANDCAMLASWFVGVLDDEELAMYKQAWQQEDAVKSGLHWYRATWGDTGASLAINATIEQPTLVLWGLADEALLPQQLDGLADYVPDLEIKTYEGVTHWIEHEIPQEIAAEMKRFME